MASVDAIFFDLGNVLAFHDNELLFRRLGEPVGLAARDVESRLSGPLWESANRGLFKADELSQAVRSALGLSVSAEEFFLLWSCHFTVNEAVLPVVSSLVGRVKLFLLSNTNFLHVQYLEPRLPILQKFDGLVLSCEVGRVKPEREIFEIALARAETRPERTLFFDDHLPFVEAAKNAGLLGRQFVGVDSLRAELRKFGL